MKYIHIVMADCIKPFMSDQSKKCKNIKEILDSNEEENYALSKKGMGDFDYKKMSIASLMSKELTESEQYEMILSKTSKLLLAIDNEIDQNFKQAKELNDKLKHMEKDFLIRQQLQEMYIEWSKTESKEIKKWLKTNKSADEFISYRMEVANSRQCIINEYFMFPEDFLEEY